MLENSHHYHENLRQSLGQGGDGQIAREAPAIETHHVAGQARHHEGQREDPENGQRNFDPVRDFHGDFGETNPQVQPEHQEPDEKRDAEAVCEEDIDVRRRTPGPSVDQAEQNLANCPSHRQSSGDDEKQRLALRRNVARKTGLPVASRVLLHGWCTGSLSVLDELAQTL